MSRVFTIAFLLISIHHRATLHIFSSISQSTFFFLYFIPLQTILHNFILISVSFLLFDENDLRLSRLARFVLISLLERETLSFIMHVSMLHEL